MGADWKGFAMKNNAPDAISWLRSVSIYHIAIAMLVLTALAGVSSLPPFAQAGAITNLLAASIAALASQALLDILTGRKAAFSEAAFISGLIIGSIIAPDASILFAVIIPPITMLCKHFLRARKLPVFNPAALGLLIANIALGMRMAWWAGTPFPLETLLMAASILLISWKLRKLSMQVAFFAVWLLLWASVVGFQFQSLISIIPLYLMAFMLIEHTTSPVKLSHQLIYACAVAIIGFALIQANLQFDGMLIALLAGNALTKILGAVK